MTRTPSSTTTESPTLITAARVITRPEDPPLVEAGVLVAGDTIKAVGPIDELVAAAPEVPRLDFPDGTVVPGLINAHVHLAFDVATDPRTALESRDVSAIRQTISRNARAVLEGGVTTVRDLGDLDGMVASFRDEVSVGDALGPRVLSAHAPLTPPKGHCWFLGGEVDTAPSGTVESERVIRAAVDDLADAGADVIKVMASGGNLTPAGAPMWKSQFTQHDLETIVAAAHERGLPVAGHAHGTDAMLMCARAGVDTIEHGSWRGRPDPDGSNTYDTRADVASAIAEAGIVLVPTRSRGWEGWPEEARLDLQLEHLAWGAEHGIRMIAGNDAGVGRDEFDDLVDAITMFGAAGWSPAEALATATTRAAAALGLSSRLGHLASGAAADLVVLGANPLDDLHALKQVRQVMVGGRLLSPTAPL